MTDQPKPLTKEEIQKRFQELCALLGDLESKHMMNKLAITEEVRQLNLQFAQLEKAEKPAEEPATDNVKPFKTKKGSKQ